MTNVFRNATKGSTAKGVGILTVLAAGLAMDSARWGTYGFTLTGIPLWCFGALASMGGILFHLGPMLFGMGSTTPRAKSETAKELFLYLRPFELDARNSVQLMVGASAGVVLYLGVLNGRWWPVAFLPLIININKEQNLEDALAQLGDFIAFGQPDEWLKPLGASRVYAQDDWKSEIRDLMWQARVVIVRPGTSASIKWEIEQLGELVPSERIVFYLKFRGWKKRRERSYQSFRDHLQSRFPTTLPEQLGKARFLIFDCCWRPHFIEDANGPLDFVHRFFARSNGINTDNLRPLLKALNLDLPVSRSGPILRFLMFGYWLIVLASVVLMLITLTLVAIQIIITTTLFMFRQIW